MSEMDKSLDEILEGRHQSHRGGSRGGVSKRRDYRGGNRGFHRGSRHGGPKPRTVMITNLYYELNEEDLDGLFTQIGPIDDIKIQYDRSGRSEGYAWVTYRYPSHAMEAIDKFDGKKAAGRPISLSIAPGFYHEKFKGNKFSERLSRRGGHRNRSRGKSEGNRKRMPKKSAEELDAELEAYMTGEQPQNNDNNNNNKEESATTNDNNEKQPEPEQTSKPTEDEMAIDE